jgi:hypothetical protein
MQETADHQGRNPARVWLRLAAVLAIGFYAGTAHLTRGYEADFGKQWLAARLVVTGQGTQLFDQRTQRAELEAHFDQAVIARGIWREGIGGPTYPPPLAVLLAPLGLLSPRWAAWTLVELSIMSVVLAARWLQRLTCERIPWEAGTLAILTLPSFFLAVGVGQNSAVSLLIFVGGLALAARDKSIGAGLVWGLFAYKPTWGLAVCWLPAVMGKPRAYWGMAISGLSLILISLPICGIDAWLDWLRVAKQTELYYQSIPRWTALSRDLPGLLRRLEHGPHVELAGWCIVLTIIGVTAWTCRKCDLWSGGYAASRYSAVTALTAGAILSCPRFMFYDMSLAAVPFLFAFADWSWLGTRARGTLVLFATFLWLGTAYAYVRSSMLGLPIDTFAVAGLWLWAVCRANRALIVQSDIGVRRLTA